MFKTSLQIPHENKLEDDNTIEELVNYHNLPYNLKMRAILFKSLITPESDTIVNRLSQYCSNIEETLSQISFYLCNQKQIQLQHEVYEKNGVDEEVHRSSFVVTTIAFLGIVYNIWSSQLSIINVPSLHKEHNGRLSIWLSLLELFGFMVFVCAVAVMILVRAAFTNMQKAMLIFWVILLHLQSANSISEVYVTLACGLFMVWYAFGKNQPPNEAT